MIARLGRVLARSGPDRVAGPGEHGTVDENRAAWVGPAPAPRSGDPWRVPRAALLGIVLVVPLIFDPTRDEVFAPIKIVVLQVGLGLGFVAAALAFLRRRPAARPAPVADLAVAGFVLWYLIGYVLSLDRSVGLRGEYPEYQGLGTTVAGAELYVLARLGFTRAVHLRHLFTVLSVVTAVIGGYALVQRLGLDPLWGSATRPFATVGQANSMAAMLLVGLPPTVATATRYTGRVGVSRVLAWGAVVLGVTGLVTSLSRGGWLGLVAASAVALAFAEPRRRRMTLVAGIAVAVLAVLALVAFAPGRSLIRDAGDRLAATATASGDGSVGQHLTLWKLGAVITVDRPWTGVGPGVFPHVALQYADERLGERDYLSLRPYWNESPHNGLLSVSTDAGLPALVAYLILVATVGTRALRAVRDGDGLAGPVLAALIGYFVASQFITPEVSSGTVFWVMLGAACGTLPSGSGSGSGSGAGSGIGSGPDIRSPAPTVAPRRFGLRHRA